MKSVTLTIILMGFCLASFCQKWQWAELFGGPGDIEAVDIATDNLNNIYVTGNYKGATTIDIGTEQLDPYGDWDIFLCSFAANGTYRWSARIGGTDRENAGAIAVDNDNNIYLVGSFKSNPVRFSAVDSLENENQYDTFLAKYDSDGNLVFASRVFWGTSQERLFDIAVDHTRNLLVMTGTFKSDLKYFDGVTNQTVPVTGVKDLFVAAYDYSGNYQDIAIFSGDKDNSTVKNIYTCTGGGYFISGDITGKVKFSQNDSLMGDAINMDAMAVRIDANLDFLWARRGGGSGYDHGNSAASDISGNLYITGKCEGTIAFDSTATLKSVNLAGFGASDFYIAKYDMDGTLQWLRRKGSPGTDDGLSISVNDLWVEVACIYSGQIIVNQDTLDSGSPGNTDTGLLLYDHNGNAIGAEKTTGDGVDAGQAIFHDITRNTYIAGYFGSTALVAGSLQLVNTSSTGIYDGFLVKFAYKLALEEADHQNVLCFGGNDGAITLNTRFGTPPFSFAWDHDPGLDSPVATGLSAGIYKVVVTDTMAGKDTLELEITEPAKIITGVITGPVNVVELDTAEYAVSGLTGSAFEWMVTGGTIITGQGTDTVEVKWPTSGTAELSVYETDFNGCMGDTATLQVNVGAAGIQDIKGEEVRIYPNPFGNQTIIEFPNAKGESYRFILSDLTGKTIRIIENIRESRIELTRDDLPAGYYFIELRGKKIFRTKVLIR